MTAAQRLMALHEMPSIELCAVTDQTLTQLVEIMNRETGLLRAGQAKQAGELSAEKTQLAQDYVTLARAIQREAPRLKEDAPDQLAQLQQRHESFATQMADNLRALATAKLVTQNILTDVATAVGKKQQPKTYGANGAMNGAGAAPYNGMSINRAL